MRVDITLIDATYDSALTLFVDTGTSSSLFYKLDKLTISILADKCIQYVDHVTALSASRRRHDPATAYWSSCGIHDEMILSAYPRRRGRAWKSVVSTTSNFPVIRRSYGHHIRHYEMQSFTINEMVSLSKTPRKSLEVGSVDDFKFSSHTSFVRSSYPTL